MSAIGELAALLMVAGLDCDQLKRALDLAQEHAAEFRGHSADIPPTSAESTYERRKKYDRDRKRARRVSADIPRNSADTPSPPSSSSPTPPLITTPPSVSSLRSESITDDWPADYRDQFWTAYPRKIGKLSAMTKLAFVRKSGVSFAALMAAVHRYAASADPQFTCHPGTWLNQGRWDDEPSVAGRGRGPPSSRSTIRSALEEVDGHDQHGNSNPQPSFELPGVADFGRR